MSPERQPFLDNARFIAVVCVVLGHCLEPWLEHSAAAGGLYRLLYAFHVPVLVFLAGSTSHPSVGGRALWKIIRALLIPYAVFQLLYLIFDAKVLGRSTLHLQWHQPYWLLWFLLSLATWRLMLPWFVSLRFRVAVLLSLGLALGAGLFPDIGYAFSASRTLVFFPFFLAGAHFGESGEKAFATRWPKSARFLGAGILVSAFILFLGPWRSFDTRWLYASYSYSSMGFAPLEGVWRRASVLCLAAVLGGAFLGCVPGRAYAWTPRGRRTLRTYLLHGFMVRAAAAFMPVFVLDVPGSVGLAIATGIVLSWLLSH